MSTGQEIRAARDLRGGDKVVHEDDALIVQNVRPHEQNDAWVRVACVHRDALGIHTTRTVPADERFELLP